MKKVVLLAAVFGLASVSCGTGKKATPIVVLPPAPVPPPAVIPVPVAPEPPKSAPPAVVTNPAPLPGPSTVPAPPAAQKPVAKRPARKRKATAAPANSQPVEASAAPVPGPVPEPTPQLQELLPADRRRQYESQYAEDVANANAALKQASKKKLTASQQEMAARVRTFLKQAADVRAQDLSTALQLARRADLLGQELAKSLK